MRIKIITGWARFGKTGYGCLKTAGDWIAGLNFSEIVQNQSEPESGTEIEIVAGSKAALEANHYVVGPAFITGANARSRFGLFV